MICFEHNLTCKTDKASNIAIMNMMHVVAANCFKGLIRNWRYSNKCWNISHIKITILQISITSSNYQMNDVDLNSLSLKHFQNHKNLNLYLLFWTKILSYWSNIRKEKYEECLFQFQIQILAFQRNLSNTLKYILKQTCSSKMFIYRLTTSTNFSRARAVSTT